MRTLPTQNRDCKGAQEASRTPLAFLLTWRCYGTHLPGQPGAVLPAQNQYNSPLPTPNPIRESSARARMLHPPYVLDPPHRDVVLTAMQQVCATKAWSLLAAHIRTNHIHVVISAPVKPESVLSVLKAYSSRALNSQSSSNRPHWARHGSTRYLWNTQSLNAAVAYVLHSQGDPMCTYTHPDIDCCS